MDETKYDKGALALTVFFLAGLLVADCRRGFADDLGHLPRVGIYGITKEEYAEARIWLARACIAEEGWFDRGGCAAVAHAYGRRYRLRRPDSLGETVRRHSAALRDRSTYSARQLFIRELPRDASSSQQNDFAATLALLDRWYQGRVKDPCAPYQVTDFGSSSDPVPLGGTRVNCSGGDNRFYVIDRELAREKRRASATR